MCLLDRSIDKKIDIQNDIYHKHIIINDLCAIFEKKLHSFTKKNAIHYIPTKKTDRKTSLF